MRPFLLRANVRTRTAIVFLVGVLIIASVQMITKYHKQVGRYHRNHVSRRAAADVVLLTSLHPGISSWSRSATPVDGSKPRPNVEDAAARKEFTITQQQRSLHIVYRLSRFNGTGRGFSRASHLIVSLLGILGMFSAIVGALIGPWLQDTGDDSGDDDRFVYWVREEEDDDDDERICGFAREEKYGIHRMLDVP